MQRFSLSASPFRSLRTALLSVLIGLLAQAILPTGVSAQTPLAPAQTSNRAAPADTASFTVTDVMIPISDTVSLHGRLYRPTPTGKARPTIFSMTPYTADDAHEYGTYFARHGYAYLNVDVRGRGASEGTFRPMMQDGPDAAAVIEWIARQSWSDGRVAMRGGSYRGMVQWQILAEDPAPLRTVVPTASAYPGWDFPNPNGIFLSYTTRWLAFVQGRASQGSLFGATAYWEDKYRRMHRKGTAFSALNEITGLSLHSSQIFERWINHPHLDDYWQAPSPDSTEYRRLDLPILTITGHFDGDQPGALRYYRKHMRYGSNEGTKQHYLLIGPWSHGGTRHPTTELNGLTFADTAAIDMNRLHRRWFEWTLGDGSKPSILQDRVVYYVMGTGQWRTAPSLKAVADTSRTLYLHSPDTNPSDPFDAGQLTSQRPTTRDVDQYVYDPRDTADVATLETMEERYTAPGAAFLEGPKLIYHSPPVEERFEMSGQMRLDAWIELNVPDTDLAAWVYEIRPTGKTIYLGQTALRARHRKGVDTSALVEPGTVQRYRFDRFYWTSRQIQKGSRIRLVIAPLNDPERQKNYNSGAPPMQETVEDARTATVRLHMDPDYSPDHARSPRFHCTTSSSALRSRSGTVASSAGYPTGKRM
ncbi:MAG: CocE/NonD family hydrolase [Salinibacter sp.]